MPVNTAILKLDTGNGGGTHTLVSSRFYDRYVIVRTGSGTLTSSWTVTSDALDGGNEVYTVEFPGGFTLGANTFTIFGKSLSSAQALNPCLVIARWDATLAAFQTQVYTDWSVNNTVLLAHMTDNSVGTSELVDAGVTLAKQANLARGTIIRGSATNRPEALDVSGAGRTVIGDGTDVTSPIPSGDWTQNGSGVNVIGANKITTAKILDAAVTWAKLQGLPRGSILRGSSANIVEALSLSGAGAGAFVNTDGTDVLARLITGDLSVSGASAATISAGLNFYIAKIDIATAAVLTLNSVPVQIAAAPGANKAIEVISSAWKMTYAGVAYATNTNLILITAGATVHQSIDTAGLAGTANVWVEMTKAGGGATDLVANQPLNVSVQTGDPTAGTSGISVYVAFRVVDV